MGLKENESSTDGGYSKCLEFLIDFNSGAESGDGYEANKEYHDFTCQLAKTADGGWDLVSCGE